MSDDAPPFEVILGHIADALILARDYGERPEALRIPAHWFAELAVFARTIHVERGLVLQFSTGPVTLLADPKLWSAVIPTAHTH